MAKFILFVTKRTSTLGVLGELGHYPLSVNAVSLICKYFARVQHSPECSLLGAALTLWGLKNCQKILIFINASFKIATLAGSFHVRNLTVGL